jgi:hypothetical protein
MRTTWLPTSTRRRAGLLTGALALAVMTGACGGSTGATGGPEAALPAGDTTVVSGATFCVQARELDFGLSDEFDAARIRADLETASARLASIGGRAPAALKDAFNAAAVPFQAYVEAWRAHNFDPKAPIDAPDVKAAAAAVSTPQWEAATAAVAAWTKANCPESAVPPGAKGR